MMGQEPPLEGESRTGGAALSGLLGAVDPVTILESSPDGIVITDQDGRILLVNERIEALFGYRREELVGEPIELLVPDRFKDRHIEHRTRYLTTPNSRSMSTALELLGQRRDGSEFPLEISLNPLESGEETYTFAAVRDVTDKVAVESESQAILGTVDAAHDGLFMFSPDTLRFSYANQGAVKQLGYSRQELLEMTPIDIAPEYSEESFRALLAPLLDGTSQSVAVTTVHRNRSGGELPVDIVFNYPPAPRRDVQRRIVALVRDISGRRQLEIERDRGVRWLQSLAALRSTLMTDPPLHEVLTLACQQVRRLTMADAVAICESISNMRLDTEAGSTALFRFRYFDSNDSANILASRQLVHHEAVDRALNGSPVVVHHQGHDAPFGEANRELTSRFDQIMLVPIEGARVVAGLLFVGRRGDEAFTEEEISVATSMAAEAHNAYSLTDARRTKIQVKILEDRERLARDLHDLVIQRIFAAGLRLQSVQGLADNPLVSERVGETVTQLDETIAELRNAIFRLNTPTISATGRLDAIIDNAASHLGFRPTLNITGDPDDLPLAVVDQLEPALSEALANVYRHASATKVEIDLVVGEDSMVLTVADNGVGFDPRGPRGSGLDNLEARALRLGGTSSVASTTGKGTAVTWTAIF